jgi:hypothetical protein
MNSKQLTREFLRQHRWRARGTLLVWSAVATLGALALTGLVNLGWAPDRNDWTLATLGLAATLLVVWFVRVRKLTPQRLARGLDTRWLLRARLESSLELNDQETTWAAAQRDDTAQSLATRKPPGLLAWRGGQIILGAVVCLLLGEGAALIVRSLRSTLNATAVAKSDASTADATRGTIEWKSPEAEIKATAIEEVPLTALVDSTTGFRSFSLEMIVNGDRELSQPLDAADLGDISKPGAHEITPSLFLDELQVKPFDIVSYRLVGELNVPGSKRTVSSQPQLVQIRPPQRDAEIAGKGGSEFPARLFELKGRQLQLIKQNAALAQLAGGAQRDPTWAPENARVADEQEKLAGRTDELLVLAKGMKPPPLVLTNLEAAEAEMKSASKSIAATANEQAAKPQNRALALLTELEQFIGQALSGSAPPAVDPIRDEQTFKLPSRSDTPAGQLEELAEQQKKANAAIAAAADSATASDADLKSAEAAVAQSAAGLGNSDNFQPGIKKNLADARTAATEAAQQLALGDRSAARVPAAAAQQALELAVEAQEKAGRAAAVAELEQVRRSLNAASRAGPGERAERLAAARTTLRTAANEQQRTGSAEAAKELAQLAELTGASPATGKRGGAGASSAPNSPERAHEVATAAAHAQVQLSAHTAAISRAVRLLNRASERTGVGNSPESIEIASQEAQWITGDAITIELAQHVAERADALQRSSSRDPAKLQELEEAAAKLAASLEHGRNAGERDSIARSFNAADVDPLYREAVETYFERLSRDGRRTAPTGAK